MPKNLESLKAAVLSFSAAAARTGRVSLGLLATARALELEEGRARTA